MFDDLLPDAVCWATASVTTAQTTELLDVEREAIVTAAPMRMREFAAGRVAARRALAGLGMAAVALPVGPTRAPIWPPGFVGSITHCDRLAVAAAARVADVSAVGIDAETARPLGPDVLDVVATTAERVRVHGPLAGTVLFSAKEAFYKCWSAAGGRMLEFDDVVVELVDDGVGGEPGRQRGQIIARPLTGGRWLGRWAVRGGFVLTAVWRPGGAP